MLQNSNWCAERSGMDFWTVWSLQHFIWTYGRGWWWLNCFDTWVHHGAFRYSSSSRWGPNIAERKKASCPEGQSPEKSTICRDQPRFYKMKLLTLVKLWTLQWSKITNASVLDIMEAPIEYCALFGCTGSLNATVSISETLKHTEFASSLPAPTSAIYICIMQSSAFMRCEQCLIY